MPASLNNPLLEAALSYAKQGWGVLPLHTLSNGRCSCGKKCASPGKHPVTANGLKDASINQKQIEKWWKGRKWNVGIVTGSPSNGLVVIDFDGHKNGLDAIPALNLPDTFKVKTGSGEHWYFHSDEDVRNSQHKLAPGVDVRGEGGYVVAPPSIHHTGNHYEVINPVPVEELPDHIIRQLAQPVVLSPITTGNQDDDLIVRDDSLMPGQVIEGQASRHEFLISAAGRLHNAGLTGLELEIALKGINQQRCRPPKPDIEVSKIAQWVSTKPSANPLPAQVNDQTPTQQQQPPTQPQPGSWAAHTGKGSSQLEIISMGDVLNTLYAPQEPVLRSLYPGQWGIVAAVSNLGKTTMLFNLCLSLACGRPFLPITPDVSKPRRILYLDYEQRREDLQWNFLRMIQVLTPAEQVLAEENLQFVCPPEMNGQPFIVSEPPAQKYLAELLKRERYDLCVIDTLGQATYLNDENSNSEIQKKVVTPFRRIANFSGCAILAIHHEGKGDNKSEGEHSAQFRTRGASALVSGARWQLSMIPTKPEVKGRIKAKLTKEKDDTAKDWVEYEIDKQTRWFMPMARPIVVVKSLHDLVVEVLQDGDGAMTPTEVSAMIPNYTPRSIRGALKDLVAQGRALKGRYGQYQATFQGDDEDEAELATP